MINEDGHQDVASAIRQCKIITEDAMQILQKLQTMSPEDSLPTWWTNKLAVTSNSMNKMRDYLLVPSVSEEVELDEVKLPSYKDLIKYKYSDAHGGAVHYSKFGGKDYKWNYVGRKGGKYFIDTEKQPEIRIDKVGVKNVNKIVKEEVELDEAVLAGRDYKYDGKGPIKISKKMYAKVKRDSKSMIKGKPYMMALDPKTQATVLAPVQFEELDATVESVVEALSAGDNVREQRRMSPAARAKRDAMRDMDARKKGGDDEVKATDADREKADRNIINKIKKAADVKNEKGSFEIKFDKGPARKVPSKLASLVLQKFNKLKPADKLKFQKQAEKSYADFLRAVKDMTK